jgi:hypothetical protein
MSVASIAARKFRSRTSLRPLLLLPALALGALACQDDQPRSLSAAATSSTDGGAGDATDAAAPTPACPVSSGPTDPTALIDDFESGSYLLPPIGGRVGGWYSDGDATPAAILQPSGDITPELISGGRCGSRHALHLTGAGFLDWGAQIITPLAYGANDAGASGFLPYDGSRYQGITFFARVGDTSSTNVRFAVADEYARPEGGICVLGGSIQTACYDTYGADLSLFLGTDWQEFRIPFAGLAQRNLGAHAATLDTSMIYDIEFDFAPNVIFDFWVDDISFY